TLFLLIGSHLVGQSPVLHSLAGLGACVDVTVPHGQVMQKKGLNVTLPCNYQTSVDKAFMLEWKFSPGSTSPDGGKQILYFTSNTLYKPGAQAKRLHLLQDPPTLGIATIQLTDLRSSDAGIYTCEVNNPPDFYGTSFGQIELIVLSKSHFSHGFALDRRATLLVFPCYAHRATIPNIFTQKPVQLCSVHILPGKYVQEPKYACAQH
uniref:V-set and immunoglobulin domain containing 2 n=1 Tax=Varanus komodoensis TaxID=61221 RepID=A0A8D2IJX4_VARKO